MPMQFDPTKHHRHSIRLKDYDYSQAGAYFVTLCSQDRECLFGDIVDCEMRLNDLGNLIVGCWQDIPSHFPNVELDGFVFMPNHLHGIIVIMDADNNVGRGEAFLCSPKNASPLRPARQTPRGTNPRSLGAIIQNFKSVSTRKTNRARETSGTRLWQRNYHEHIIRDEKELNRIREYISGNPAHWSDDENNPNRKK